MNIIETVVIAISSGLIGGYISYYFAEKNERYKFELVKRGRAEKIAELFALWIKFNEEELNKLSDAEKVNHLEGLNRATWELVIWVSDENIVKNVMDVLSKKSKKSIKEIIFDIRNQVQGRENRKLKWEDIVHFNK
jgi:hypothetical protein